MSRVLTPFGDKEITSRKSEKGGDREKERQRDRETGDRETERIGKLG